MVDSSEVFYGSNFIDFSLFFLFSDLYIHQHLKGQTKYVLKMIKIIKMKKFCTTIGNFDGLHIGHKAMITEIINKSKLLDLSSQVITFNPYPFEHFKFDKKRILGDRDKLEMLNDLGVDRVISIDFNQDFSELTAESFFTKYILDEGTKYLTVGKDFKFGKDRSGNVSILENLCKQNGIKIENKSLELISGSLLEVVVKFNLRDSLSVPDTSVMIEGDKSYVYQIDNQNNAKKIEVKTGIRGNKNIEIISGLSAGDIIVAEGLKKVRPNGKIKPIKK